MIQNSRFSVAVHSLMMVAASQGKIKMTSDLIAQSTGMNAVTIRHVFGKLKSAGLLDVKPGPGGAKLAIEPPYITLYAIYAAVEENPFADLFYLNQNNAEWCPVGRNVNHILADRLEYVTSAAMEHLKSVTLADLLDDLREIEPELEPNHTVSAARKRRDVL
jgi:DNA-binding IscR family transcriptional regulator